VLGGIAPALPVIATAGVVAALASYAWLLETRGLEVETIAPEMT